MLFPAQFHNCAGTGSRQTHRILPTYWSTHLSPSTYTQRWQKTLPTEPAFRSPKETLLPILSSREHLAFLPFMLFSNRFRAANLDIVNLNWDITATSSFSRTFIAEPPSYATAVPLPRRIFPLTRSTLFRASAAIDLFISKTILDCVYTMRLRSQMNDLSNSRCRLCESTTETPERLWICSGKQDHNSLPLTTNQAR